MVTSIMLHVSLTFQKMGNAFNAFKEQLDKSQADPQGMFLNDAVKKLLKM